jgi:hypothetical protein
MSDSQAPALPPAALPKGTVFLRLDPEVTSIVHDICRLRGEPMTKVIAGVLLAFGPVVLQQELMRTRIPGNGA